jgi:2-keto-4-pentenoate hydratase/2-oxohepta-3-ene-1,7-dioic acid hydratase in catechol pathway
MKLIKVVMVVIGLGVAALVGRSIQVSQGLYDERIETIPKHALRLAPVADTLTFARTRDNDVLLVAALDQKGVVAVNLTEFFDAKGIDTLALYRNLGSEVIRTALDSEVTFIEWEALGLPFEPRPQAVAAGTNFAAHAEEVGLDEGPFLFPKISKPSAWNDTLPESARLDYEVELCAVPIDDYAIEKPSALGVTLCNDFTDRWDLVRTIDLDGPLGRTGFADGKSGERRLPLGALLVVPQELDTFLDGVALGLAVNGDLRQQGRGSQMIWNASKVMQETLHQCDQPYQYQGAELSLTECGAIKAGTVVMLGTPDGVAFQMPNIWMPWPYLHQGDEVLTFASHLGVLRTRITR